MFNSLRLGAMAIVCLGLLSSCAAQGSTPQLPPPPPAPAPPADRSASKWFVKDTSVCFVNLMSNDAVNISFGTDRFPIDSYTNGNMSSPAGKGGPVPLVLSTGWVCADTRNDVTWDVAGIVDVLSTVTFPNGRKTTFGFANPSLESPIFYPANESGDRGPGSGQEYKIPEGSTYSCSMLGYDFTVTQQPDDADYKYWLVKIIGKAAPTDDFDSKICQP